MRIPSRLLLFVSMIMEDNLMGADDIGWFLDVKVWRRMDKSLMQREYIVAVLNSRVSFQMNKEVTTVYVHLNLHHGGNFFHDFLKVF